MTDPEVGPPVPSLPGLSRELGSLAFPLQRVALSGDDRPFTLTGARATVTGGHARGVDAVRAGPLQLLSRLRVEGAAPAGSVLTPLGVERRLTVGAATVLERVVVAPADAVCLFEWAADGDSAATLSLSWTLPASAWRRADRGLVATSPEGRRVYAFSRRPAELAVAPAGRLRVSARLELRSGEPVRLGIAGIARDDDEGRVLRVLGRSHVVVPTRRAEAQRIMDERLAVEAPADAVAGEEAGEGVGEEGGDGGGALGEALAWAKLGLAAASARSAGGAGGAPSRSDARLVLAMLASGDPGPARAMVMGQGWGPGVSATTGYLLVLARYLAWTGDLATVNGAWAAGARAGVEAWMASVAGGGPGGRRDGVMGELVVVAEEVGDEEMARLLRAAEGELAEGELADESEDESEDESDEPVGVELEPAAGGGADGDLAKSAALVEAVVRGLLGAEPDAPRGRLVLRPRLPASWRRFGVRNLVVGEAVVELEYDRDGGRHRLTLRQARGGPPLRVILEPELAGGRLVGARVDGEPAELDTVPVAGRLRVPVQIVLDHERCVEVEIEDAGA